MVVKKILVMLSKWGYWGEEFIAPYNVLVGAGYTCDFMTVHGRTAPALPPSRDVTYKAAAQLRTEQISQSESSRLQAEPDPDQDRRDDIPLRMSHFAEELAAQLPDNAIIFDEALTNPPAFVRYYPVTKPEGGGSSRGKARSNRLSYSVSAGTSGPFSHRSYLGGHSPSRQGCSGIRMILSLFCLNSMKIMAMELVTSKD
jgi:hypothetical protein